MIVHNQINQNLKVVLLWNMKCPVLRKNLKFCIHLHSSTRKIVLIGETPQAPGTNLKLWMPHITWQFVCPPVSLTAPQVRVLCRGLSPSFSKLARLVYFILWRFLAFLFCLYLLWLCKADHRRTYLQKVLYFTILSEWERKVPNIQVFYRY
jgi:hypothetical protein